MIRVQAWPRCVLAAPAVRQSRDNVFDSACKAATAHEHRRGAWASHRCGCPRAERITLCVCDLAEQDDFVDRRLALVAYEVDHGRSEMRANPPFGHERLDVFVIAHRICLARK